ncbi:MAG: L-aspartate oxidase [Phycisphaerae bacterium]|nr:L-aspartate oxidase [Phycisphaerae bacterium]
MNDTFLQRRYLVGFESRRLPHIFTDVLVIGGGAAGLRAAIEAAAHGQVILVTKGDLLESNTYHAQGGLAAVMAEDDSSEQHVADTLAAACGIGDEKVIRTVVTQAPQHVREMQSWGVKFDTDGGELSLGREGGHHAHRIVHARGDATGRALAEVLVQRARDVAGLKIFEACFAIDLVTDPPDGGPASTCLGALTFNPHYGLQMIRARVTILAGGGAGMLWRETTNPPCATADPIAMVFRAGGTVGDAEMMQFHPTTLYVAGATRSLISEAVRGEGGFLVDRTGARFMAEYHEMADLAPRDVVSRAIVDRMAKTHSTHVFLDVRGLGEAAFAERFPFIDEQCRHFGIRPGSDLIPVHPAAHYMIGGAWVDLDGHTSIANLLACGEAACTGLHGANRLASNSLTEALIFGQRCGQTAGAILEQAGEKLASLAIDWVNPRSERTQLDLADIRNSLRAILWRNVGIVRRGERLTETLEIVCFWGRYVLDKEFFERSGWEVQNMLTGAYLTVEAALRRTETRGVHYREDFPAAHPAWARHQFMRRGESQLVVE